MKKIIYTGVIALGLGLMSFTTPETKSINIFINPQCWAYASSACQVEEIHFGSMSRSEYLTSFSDYYGYCTETSYELTQEPIFLD